MRSLTLGLCVLLAACSSSTTPTSPDLAPPPCASNTDCASTPARPVCAKGACVVCAADGDCGMGKKCDAIGMKCVDCLVSSDCAAGSRCVMGACAFGCDPKSPCPAGKVCDPTTSVCVQCAASSDCSSPTGVCDTGTHQCVGCLADGDCGAGKVCNAHSCADGCSAAHPMCANGTVCNLSTGACVGCVADTDCKDSSTPRCDPRANSCVQCQPTNDNCASGTYCSGSTCATGCKSDGECSGATPRCDIVHHACVQCVDNSACATGTICVSNKCVAGCTTDANCGSGQACCGGACAQIRSDAKNCGACGNACASGVGCCNGNCTSIATVNNCGACGVTCNTAQSCCGGTCAGLTTVQNCGACGTTCGAGQGCCGGSCASLTTSQNCGACGTVCTTGQACCAGGCIDITSDAKNCGACGKACNTGVPCFGGMCGVPASCLAVQKLTPSAASGVYSIDPDGPGGAAPISTYCDMSTDGGGWTVCAQKDFAMAGPNNHMGLTELTTTFGTPGAKSEFGVDCHSIMNTVTNGGNVQWGMKLQSGAWAWVSPLNTAEYFQIHSGGSSVRCSTAINTFKSSALTNSITVSRFQNCHLGSWGSAWITPTYYLNQVANSINSGVLFEVGNAWSDHVMGFSLDGSTQVYNSQGSGAVACAYPYNTQQGDRGPITSAGGCIINNTQNVVTLMFREK